MKSTYPQAISQILKDEGGYTNNPKDPGGPTNWGITLHDARTYWKADATAEDVKDMPESVAEDIYLRHYASAVNYDGLPPGVDYAVLDYAVNSGVVRALKTYNVVKNKQPVDVINYIYNTRLAFLESLSTFRYFGKGWTRRCVAGKALAISLYDQYKTGDAPNLFMKFWNIFPKGKYYV